MEPNYWWLIYPGLLLIVLELVIGVSAGFDLVIVGLCMLLGGAVAYISGSFLPGLIAASVFAFLYIIFGRAFFRKKLLKSPQKLNIDRLVGGEAVVTKTIEPHQPGQVNVSGEIWRATAKQQIAKDTVVIIKTIEGVTLGVEASH